MTGGSSDGRAAAERSRAGDVSGNDGPAWHRALPGLVGLAVLVFSVSHLRTHGRALVGYVAVGVPIGFGTLLVAFGLWNRDNPVSRRQSAGLFLGTALGGVLFGVVALWLLFIVGLDGPTVTPRQGRYLLLNAVAIGAVASAVLSTLYVRFRTERERLDRTAAALRERNERLDRFASMVSHDLRNPLSIAKGRTELAYEDPASARAHLEPAIDALTRIDARLQDLLALARAGDVDATDAVSLRAAALTAWGDIDIAGATLEVDDGTVEASERLLVQALENLLENAVEHGGPDVSVRVEALADGGFRVSDDGPGITARERERILEPGVSSRERANGHGEGLAIVEDIAEAHDWDLVVGESELGGARFECRPRTATVDRVTTRMMVVGD